MSFLSRVAKSDLTYPTPGTLLGDAPKVTPFQEVGVSGLLRTLGTGYVYEEWLASLSTYRARQVYREMRDNDAVIGSMFFALEMLLRGAEWYVEPANASRKAEQYAQYLRDCMDDMSHTWAEFIAEGVNMFAFGFSLFETVYKRRQGADGKRASKFDDGLIGWRKMAPRAQESIQYWVWDEEGGLQGAVQLAAPNYKTTYMPIESLLLLRTTSIKNNPEGRSLLRNCFRSWSFKKRLEEVEGIGIERDLCGLPVVYASADAVTAAGGEAKLRRLITNIRVDDQMGVLLPLAYDDKGNPQIKLELMKSGGSKQTKAHDSIQRYNQDILSTVLAGFIGYGHSETGSRAMHISATQIFAKSIKAYMQGTAATINRIAITRLMALNAMDLSLAPKLVPGDIDVRDLQELSDFILKLSQADAASKLFSDPSTQTHFRKLGDLPDAPAEEQPEVPLDDPDEPAAGTEEDAKPGAGRKPKPQESDTPDDQQQASERLQETA